MDPGSRAFRNSAMEGGVRLSRDDAILKWSAAAAGIVLLIFLLLGLREVLNPPLIFLGLVGVLLPLRRTSFFPAVVGTTGFLVLFWLFRELGFILAPFVLALVLSYILNPAVGWIADRRPLVRFAGSDGRGRFGRTLAVLALAIPVVGGMVALGIWGVPYLAAELSGIVRRAPQALERLASFIQGLEERFAAIQIPGFDGSEWLARAGDLDADAVVEFVEERQELIWDWLREGALGLGRGLGVALSVLGYLVLAPVLTFYLLRDYDRLAERVVDLIPPSKGGIRWGLREYDRLLSAYLRGQVMVSLTVGAMTTAGLLIVQFPYAFFLGAVVAIFNVVPYLGLVLSLIPAVAIALASGDPFISLLKMGIVYTIAQSLESGVVSPRIVGDSTGLHPVWILLAIVVSGFFFGFVGLLIAVPIAVGIKLLLAVAGDRYRSSPLFQVASDGEASEGEPEVAAE
ncbi:MAG: AI-2E family transporter [Gemmatimonadales bacterium]|nr:MAG: AI-2E family transporter [Gemmatimonadales bacterium]